MSAILAIDQGTTNTKALLVSPEGAILARASRPLAVSYPRPGWTEQSPADIWQSVVDASAQVLEQCPSIPVAAIAIANQRETITAWDAATGEPIADAITWQCRRSSSRCAELRKAGCEPLVMERTGLALDPLAPSAKISWLLDHVPGARDRAAAGRVRVGTVDSWLLWRLTGGRVHATDASNASRTQLLGIETCQWDPDMLDLFGVPPACLPAVRPSDARFGETARALGSLPAGTPIQAMLGDSHAALLGHGFDRPRQAKVTCGTGSSLMATTPERVRSHHGLASTIAWQRGTSIQYALEGNVAVSGHAAAFAVRLLNLPGEETLTQLAMSVPTSEGVTFVPALAGLGAPHWIDGARGQIGGMSLGTSPAHVARAVLEGIALQIGDVFAAMEADLGHAVATLSVDGGASRNDFLMQLLADAIARPVIRPHHADMGALGVARLAGDALGLGNGPRDKDAPDRFEPSGDSARREELRAAWRLAVQRASLGCT